MSQKIQFRRGVYSEIGSIVFDPGEPAYVVDRQTLHIGNGTGIGGNSVIMSYSGVPTSITSNGISGQFKVLGDKLYISTGNNQWGRINISSF